jgi:hypothetical protein
VHIHDVAEVPGYPEIFIKVAKQRTSLGVPLLREGEAIGYIVLARQRVEPFTYRQIALVSTLADQAVIAIENTRLMTEQREALEQQTATAEVLQVINASPGDLLPVFDAILAKAMHLCDAAFGMFNAYDGTSFRTVVTRGVPAAFAAFRAKNPPTPSPGSPFGRAFETKRPVHIFDWLEEPAYKEGTPGGRAIADLGAARTVLNVPLVRNSAVLGMISFYRQQVRPFLHGPRREPESALSRLYAPRRNGYTPGRVYRAARPTGRAITEDTMTATIRPRVPAPAQTSPTMRPTRAVVLPVPAAASTKKLEPNSVRIRRRAAASAR